MTLPHLSALELLEQLRPPWQRDALCREYPHLAWFPIRGQSAGPALQVCGRCAVMTECRAWALADPSLCEAGVIGGMTPNARQAARSLAHRRDPRATPSPHPTTPEDPRNSAGGRSGQNIAGADRG